jgi:ribosomal protein L33
VNEIKQKVFKELNEISWYCPVCQFTWDGEEEECPVCLAKRFIPMELSEYLAEYRCTKCYSSMVSTAIQVQNKDDINIEIEKTCPRCEQKTIHILEEIKPRKRIKQLSVMAEEIVNGRTRKKPQRKISI